MSRIKPFIFKTIIQVNVILLTFMLTKNYYDSKRVIMEQTQHDSETAQTSHKYYVDLFKEIGNKSGTDKIFTHNYENLYGFYFGPIRKNKLNFLEIGLGCTMWYGAGKSIPLWKEFFPNSIVNIAEYDRKCAEKFKDQVDKMYIGDQKDFDFLKQIGKDGPFDIIIDDGGHMRSFQINSLIGLWPYVKSGGYYVIEDIFTSYAPNYDDNPGESALDVMMQLIALLNDGIGITHLTIQYPNNIPIKEHSKNILSDLLFVSCYRRICILGKK